jgi:nucleoside phosphorylase
MILVGIAGGLEGRVKLGDVIVPDTIWYYELARREEEELPRPVTFKLRSPLDRILGRQENLRRNWVSSAIELGNWANFLPSIQAESTPALQVHTQCVLASGEKLLADGKTLANLQHAGHEKIRATDMEGAGFALACNGVGDEVPWLVVRGVSDFSDSDKRSSSQRPRAALVAAQYVRCMLEDWVLDTMISGPSLQVPHSTWQRGSASEYSLATPPYPALDESVFFSPDDQNIVQQGVSSRSTTTFIGFLSTSNVDPRNRYHLGHAFFLLLLSWLYRRTERVSLVICDTPTHKREFQPGWSARLIEQSSVWQSAIQQHSVQYASHRVSARDEDSVTNGVRLVTAWQERLEASRPSQMQREKIRAWRSNPQQAIELHDVMDLLEQQVFQDAPQLSPEEMLSLAFVLGPEQPNWFEPRWFVKFALALASGRFGDDSGDIVLLEANKNRVAWEAMSGIARMSDLPFPRRVYFNDFPGLDGRPMQSSRKNAAIVLAHPAHGLNENHSVTLGQAFGLDVSDPQEARLRIEEMRRWAGTLLNQSPQGM